MSSTNDLPILPQVIELALLAGAEILKIYSRSDHGVVTKADSSPLTEADLRAHEVIEAGLLALGLGPVVSEESIDLEAVQHAALAPRHWLVDPLDGTREFVARRDWFTVNIALLELGIPTLGVVYAPAKEILYYAEKGHGAYRQTKENPSPIRILNSNDRSELVAVASQAAHGPRFDQLCLFLGIREVQRMGSAIKLCMVADGSADVYPRFGNTSEWDTAAAHAILNEAGCELLDVRDGMPLQYGKPQFLNHGFIAARTNLSIADSLSRFKRENEK